MADPDTPPPTRAIGGSAVVLVVLVAAAIALGTVLGARSDDPGAAGGPATAATTAGTLPAGPIDIGFAQDMLDHHQQALQMGMLAAGKATTTPVRSLALSMIATQQEETGRFRQFLADRGYEDGEPGREVMAWMGHPVPFAQMPGLIPPDQLVTLTNAEGRDFDRRFVELMLEHHRGATEMAQHALEHGESEFTREMADRILVHQRRELTDLESLLPGLTP